MRMGIGLGVGINRSNYAQGIFNAYSARVVVDGGITEGGACVDAVSGLLLNASLLLIPSGYKGGRLYSQIPTNGNGDLTWTRGSDAFRTNASGVLQRVPWNLLQYSEDFTNAVWGKTNVTVSGNTTTAPNGTLTADTLTTTATTGRHLLLYGDHSATTITASIYVKKNTHNFIQIFTGWASVAYANYDINNGVVGDVGSGTVASITNVGNGWYRCSFTSPAASASTIRWNLVTSSTAVYNESWTANGTESVYIWGAQLVEGTTAQTYLPTTDRLNFPRLSYMYGSCPSALLEPQRTNLCLWSNSFSNAVWQTSSLTVSDNNSTGIDGNQTACLVTTSATGNFLFQNITVLSNTTYTLTFYVKRGTMTDMKYRFRDVTNSNDIIPVTSYYSQTNSSTFTRIIVTLTTPIGCVQLRFYPFSDTGSIGTAFITQAQCEQGAYSSTIIPTTSATATRVADSFSRSNIYTNGLISASGGTWFVELRGNVEYLRSASTTGLSIGDTSTGVLNGICIRNATSSPAIRLTVSKMISGSLSALYTTTTDTTKIAIKWNGTSMDVFVNGTKQISATAFTTTVMEYLLCDSADVPRFIQQMALFSTPLSDTDCTTLTTL